MLMKWKVAMNKVQKVSNRGKMWMSMIRSTLYISNFEKTGLHIEITLLPHFSLSLGQDIFYDNKFFYNIYFYSPQLQRRNV